MDPVEEEIRGDEGEQRGSDIHINICLSDEMWDLQKYRGDRGDREDLGNHQHPDSTQQTTSVNALN